VSRAGLTEFLSWRTALAVALLVGVCGTLSAAGEGVAASGTTRIVAAAPRLPKSTRVLGAVRADASISGAVVLRPRSEADLTRFIAAVTDKHSPLFHQYLAPGQFAARFGPAPSSIAAVTSRLRAEGLSVTVAPNGMLVDFRGSAAQVEHAFGVGLERIHLANGRFGRARTAAIRLPSSLAGLVTSVVGLDNVLRLRSAAISPRGGTHAPEAHVAAKTTAFPHPAGSPTPCSSAQGAAAQFGGLTDDQIANAYGAFGLYGANDVGTGQSIGVFELEPFAPTDIQTFDACYFGVPAATAMAGRLHTIPVDGGQPAGPGSGESLLDIEDISALAPGATINVYEAPNTTFGAIDEYSKIVNNDTDQTVSTSWGLCEAAVEQGEPGVLEAENLLFQQAAAQGQSVFSAAGDEGSNDCNAFYEGAPVTPILSTDDPSSQPYVVGVGGTTIENPTQPALEHVWNDGSYWGAGGGGISEAWPMPAWQLASQVPGIGDTGTIAAANSLEAADLSEPGYAFCQTDNPAGTTQAACREVPDVSAQADEFTGGVTVYTHAYGGWQTYGGTSSAAPIWAALLAVANESSTCQSHGDTENGVGFVSPLLYSVASNPTAYAASFNDITAGNNDPYGYSGLFPATTGYDMASGLGSPQLTAPGNAAGLAYYLCTAAHVPGTRPTVSSIADNVAFTSASSTDVTITGTNFENNSTPDVATIQIGDYVLQQDDFAVDSPTSISATFPAAANVLPSQATNDGAGRVQVVVTLNDGESSAPSPGSAFTYVDNKDANEIPAVTSVGPYGGPDAGGNTVDIYGAGFIGATDVKFGGVSATFNVVNDWHITATVPAYDSIGTDCAQDGSSYGTGENATNDVCQTQVVVSNSHADSTKAEILPLYEGDASFSELGIVPAPNGEEPAPAATEYDYFPPPTITSISTDGGPSSLASEEGDSVVTITGTGLNLAGLDWVDVGDPTLADSQDFDLVTATGKEIQIAAPPLETETTGLFTAPVTVTTLAGESGSLDLTYAGIPTVHTATATAGPTAGKNAGPDTGGTPIDVTGEGFTGQVLGIAFVDALGPFSTGTQYHFTALSDTDLTSSTVPQSAGLVDVEACTVTGCSFPSPTLTDAFLLYPPGDPTIDSITPAKGPASGGTRVKIMGENLGCVENVYFGKVAAKKVSNGRALLDCGSTTQVIVVAPPGTTGKSVRVTLTTVESDVTGFGPTTDTLHFTYTRALPQRLTVKRTGSGTVASSPSGVSCGKTCSHRYPYQAVVKLTAAAASGWRFAGWSGACKGKGTCKVHMKAEELVNARFVR
jgi:Pro-kumamolisin, activation domain/Divergent InlB B-repeat domain/IPT/TIG domain